MAHLIPKLGSIGLSDLQPAHIQRYYSRLLKNGRLDGKPGGLSPRTVLSHHRVLSEALSHGVKWGLVVRNIAGAVDPPRPQRGERIPPDSHGISRLLDASRGTVYHPVLHLAAYTGLRRSELLGLRWHSIDLDLGTLSIVQVMHRLRDGRIIFQESKTAKSRRMVALSPVAILSLRSHREKQEADRAVLGVPFGDDDLAFSKPDGSPFLPDTLSHAVARIARRAGLRGVRLHDLRHAHATLMLRQGVHPKIVQERLGHSTIAVTLDTYSHVTPGLQEAAALKFEEEMTSPRPVAAVVG